MNVLWLLTIIGVSPYVVWDKSYDAGFTDKAHGTILTEDGIVVVGETKGDVLIYKYSRDTGDSLWCVIYDNGGTKDIGWDVAAVPGDNLFLGIISNSEDPDSQVFICFFSQEGSFFWAKNIGFRGAYIGPSLSCRHKDSCYVAGWSNNSFLFLFKEDGTWVPTTWPWGSESAFSGIDIDQVGNVYISVSALGGCGLSKHSRDGSQIWGNAYSPFTPTIKGWQCRVAPSQEIFLCGEDSLDFLLLKWDPDGIRLWDPAKTYDLGAAEYCRDMALDSIADCYLAGWQAWGSEEDAALVKTDSAGTVLWLWVDTVAGLQEIEAIEVDKDGYIYLAGSYHNGTDWDALVMKIRQPLTVTGNVTDSTGKVMKNTPVAVSGDTTLEVNTNINGNYEITIYNGGNYIVKPNLPGYGFEPAQRTYTPLAHREWNQDFDNGHWTAVAEQEVTGAPTLEVKGSLVYFSIPGNREGSLKIYNSSGQLVKRTSVKGQSSIDLTPTLSSGVYFVKLETRKINITRKWVFLK